MSPNFCLITITLSELFKEFHEWLNGVENLIIYEIIDNLFGHDFQH